MTSTGRQMSHAIDTLATIVGTCALVLFAIWLSTLVGAFLTIVIGIAFVLSDKKRHLFDLIARPLRHILRRRSEEGVGDAGFRRGSFNSRSTPSVVIDHDPNEFNRKRY
jgi:hypothetical protein